MIIIIIIKCQYSRPLLHVNLQENDDNNTVNRENIQQNIAFYEYAMIHI